MLRRTLSRSEGQAAVEFALILPVLVALLLAILQFGIIWNNYVTVTDAVRAGARKAATSRFLNDNGASAVAAVRADEGSLNDKKLTVSVASTNWTTPGSTVTVTATYPYSVNILGWTVKSGTLTSTSNERLE